MQFRRLSFFYRRAGFSVNVKQISIFIENKPGALHNIVDALIEHNIHLRAFTVLNIEGLAMLRIIVDNVLWTASLLKNNGVTATFTEVLVAEVSDSGTGLLRVLDILRDGHINIEHAYPIMSKNTALLTKEIYMVLEVDDTAKAMKLLEDEGINIVSQEDLSVL